MLVNKTRLTVFWFIPKALGKVEVRALCWSNHFFMELALCSGALSC